MNVKPLHLVPKELKSNYHYWISQWKKLVEPEETIKAYLQKHVLTTHSFPFERQTQSGYAKPYESIFSASENNGILSNGFRELLGINPDSDASARNIPPNIKNYVFAYLGIHQPYYARTTKGKLSVVSKPFGIFIKNQQYSDEVELSVHNNHASRRDMGSKEAAKEWSSEVLYPADARTLMAYQVCNDPHHQIAGGQMDSFWHYYGNLKHWNEEDGYADNAWEKKAEFRYFGRIKPDDIAAVLWPVWQDGTEDAITTQEDLVRYGLQYPAIQFISYPLDLRDPEICFIEASYVALVYYLKNSFNFPDSITAAKKVLGDAY